MQRRLLLIGWDSADWKLIHPLVDSGQMPAMSRLLDKGVCGNLTTIEPQLSPMLWTSIATGKHAYHHGVSGFTEVNAAGQVVPVSAATRRCKSLWDMLGEHGMTSHVVSWFATHGERPRGCLVSNLYNSWKHKEEDVPAAWPSPPSGTYWPEDLGNHLNELRVSPWDIDPDEVIRLFVPDADQVDQKKDQRLWMLAKLLGEAFSVHSATCWLLENRPDWNLFAVYYRAIDEICHSFMLYHPPQMAGVKDDDFAIYQHVVTGAYRLHDLFLARLMDLAGPETAIMLVSDHGFHSDHLRPRFTPRVPAGITVWHRPQGIFCAMGPGFKKDENLFGARLLDVAPTILTWLGLPVGADMEGRVLLDAFVEPPAVSTIPSWESTGNERQLGAPLDARNHKALLDQFIELGYIDPVSEDSSEAAIETNRENDWNMARACMDGGRFEEALPLLESVWQLHPERNDYAQMLAVCQMRLGLFDEASETMEVCMETLGGKTAGAFVMLANIAMERGRAAEAMEHLQAAEAVAGEAPTLHQLELLGRAQLALRHWDDCAASCRKVLALDPMQPAAFLGLARCSLHSGRADEAAEHALEAIGVQYGNPLGHFLLGMALLQLDQWREAASALATTVKLHPRHAPAHRLLAIALDHLGDHKAAEGAILKARMLRAGNEAEYRAKLDTLREESAARAAELRKVIDFRRAEGEARRKALEESALPADQEFVIVSGLPRSGTSLMMQMLRAGGLEPMTDGHRPPDEDNPKGYWEWEKIRQLPKNPLLIEQAHGKATKVIAALLPALPPKHRYKVIFMTRPVEEVVTSQTKMLQRRGATQRANTEHLETLQREQVEKCLQILRDSPRVDLLEVPFPALVAEPSTWCERVGAYLGKAVLTSPEAMAACVNISLYRNRKP